MSENLTDEIKDNLIALLDEHHNRIKKMMDISYEFYDTIDFTEFIQLIMNNEDKKCINVRTLMDALEVYYDNNHPELLPPELEGNFFDAVNEDEFVDYLKKRYYKTYKTYHEVVENYYIYKTYS